MMTGVIWLVQVTQYPLFAEVGRDAFRSYHAGHTGRITYVVLPLMSVELVTAAFLSLYPPPGIPRPWLVGGLGLVGVTWLSTVLIQVPLHEALAAGFDADAHARLVNTNWVRTIAWTARAVLTLGVTIQLIGGRDRS